MLNLWQGVNDLIHLVLDCKFVSVTYIFERRSLAKNGNSIQIIIIRKIITITSQYKGKYIIVSESAEDD